MNNNRGYGPTQKEILQRQALDKQKWLASIARHGVAAHRNNWR
jgi:hypothetical protein